MNNINDKIGNGDPGWTAGNQCFQSFRPKWDRKLIRSVIWGFLVVCPTFASPAAAHDATRLVTTEARRQGVPAAFALRVARVESGIHCGRHNRSGATGPLQIMPRSARALGYRGNIRRASCATQTHWGMRHLAMCYRGAHGNQARAAACHYQGISALHRVTRAGAAYARRVR